MTDLTQIKSIRDICDQICDVYRKKMKDAGYNTLGELYNFKEVIEYNGNLFTLSIIVPDYFQYAEYGRGPGKMPPIENIIKWIQFKHLVPRSINGKVPTTTLLAFAISKHIAEHGTEGKHLLLETIDSTYNNLVDLLVNLITELLEKELNEDIDNL